MYTYLDGTKKFKGGLNIEVEGKKKAIRHIKDIKIKINKEGFGFLLFNEWNSYWGGYDAYPVYIDVFFNDNFSQVVLPVKYSGDWNSEDASSL